jgi:hypothetical protein
LAYWTAYSLQRHWPDSPLAVLEFLPIIKTKELTS